MKVIAYGEANSYTGRLAQAFAAGCERNDVDCVLRNADQFCRREVCDLVWLYGLHDTQEIFDAYDGHALRVVGDLGYWREHLGDTAEADRPVRISIEAQQPDRHLCLRVHSGDRFDALRLPVTPVAERGVYILLAGHDSIQARRAGYEYGAWEIMTASEIHTITMRPISLRAKPGCAPLHARGERRGTPRGVPTYDTTAEAIRQAWAVVCFTGNIGADAILHGVPVFARAGPGAVYHHAALDALDYAEPLAPAARLSALADLAYWQWTPAEFASGAFWAHLAREVLH